MIQGHIDNIQRQRAHVIKYTHAVSTTILNMKEAVTIFKEKRGTINYHMDEDFRVHKAEKAKGKIDNDLPRMHIAIYDAFNTLEEAERKRAQQGSSEGQNSASNDKSAVNSFASGNFLNTKILHPNEHTYTGVPLIALNKHISNA